MTRGRSYRAWMVIGLMGLAGLVALAAPGAVGAAPPSRPQGFVHVADQAVGGNICSIDPAMTVLDHPLANGNPSAVIVVTINEGLSSVPGFTVTGPASVFYDDAASCGTAGRWVILSRDLHAIPTGQRFNVVIFP